MLNKLPIIPVFGWLYSLIMAFFTAIPMYFLWNGIGQMYFGPFLPQVFSYIPFWNMVGLLMLIAMLKGILLPGNLSLNSSANGEKRDDGTAKQTKQDA